MGFVDEQVWSCVCAYVCVCMNIKNFIYNQMYVCPCVCVCIHAHTHTHIFMCMSILDRCTQYTHTHTYIHSQTLPL